MRSRSLITIPLLIVSLLFATCANHGPAEMHYGEDRCDYCKMHIADAAFGSQLITGKGKAFKFDSIECLAAYEWDHADDLKNATRWLGNINSPGAFLSGADAVVVHGRDLRSPMGLGLAATASEEEARRLAAETNGEVISWTHVHMYVAEAWDLE